MFGIAVPIFVILVIVGSNITSFLLGVFVGWW